MKELTLVQRAAAVLNSSTVEIDLQALAASSADIKAVIDPAGREQAHRIAMNLSGARVAIKKTGKASRDDMTAFSKAIIAEENRLVAIIEPEEIRVLALRNEFDEKLAAEKQAKIDAELARVATIEAKINRIRSSVTVAIGRNSDEITKIIAGLKNIEISEENYSDLTMKAKIAVFESVEAVNEILTKVIAEELAKKEADEKAAELARLAQLQAEELARQAKLQAEELARQKIELDRAQKEARELAAIQSALKAEQDAQFAKQKAEFEEEKRLQAERMAKFEEMARLRERSEQERLGDEILAAIEEKNIVVDCDLIQSFEIKNNAGKEIFYGIPPKKDHHTAEEKYSKEVQFIISKEDIILIVSEEFDITKIEADRYIRAAFEI